MENRVWVYMSENEFSDAMRSEILTEIENFLSGWNAHGQQLNARGEILFKRFIVIAADEAMFSASGCSIDKLIHFIQHLEKKHHVNLFNRLLVGVKNEKDMVEVYPSSKIKEMLLSGLLDKNSIVFNSGICNEKDLENSFFISLKNSWLNKYLIKDKA